MNDDILKDMPETLKKVLDDRIKKIKGNSEVMAKVKKDGRDECELIMQLAIASLMS